MTFREKISTFVLFSAFLLILVFIIGGFFLFRSSLLAADGSGSVSVSPDSVRADSTGNTFAFTFTAAENMPSGGLSITVPSGWSAPQGIAGTSGYTTVATTGMLAKVEDAADSLTGWTNNGACDNGFSVETTIKHEGTGSLRCAIATANWGDVIYKSIPAENWSGYTKIGFWIYSTKELSYTHFSFAYSSNAVLSSSQEYLNMGSQIVPANQWTFVTMNFGAFNRSTIRSYGLFFSHFSAEDNATVYIDDIMLGPGTPLFSGNDIRLNFLQLNAGQTATVTYGATGGASGVTVPASAGSAVFDLKTRTTDSGILTGVASPPVVMVGPAATRFVILDPIDGSVDGATTVTIQAQDELGNIDTSYQNDVTLVVSGSVSGGGLVDIVNGVGTITISDQVAETVTLSLMDSQVTGLSVRSAQDTIFSPGAVAQFVLDNPGDMMAGTRLGYQVFRKDQYGNLVTSETTDVFLYSDSSSGTGRFYAAANGGDTISSLTIQHGSSSGVFWYEDENIGAWSIQASDHATAPDGISGIDDATDQITVSPVPIVATRFVILDPGDVTVDQTVTVTVQAQDEAGNIDTTYQQDVALAASGSVAGTGTVDIVNGVGTITISDQVAEIVTLSLADTFSTGLNSTSMQEIIFSPGATVEFVLTDPGDTVSGSRLDYSVIRKDQYGNAVTAGSQSAYLYTTMQGNAVFFYETATATDPVSMVTFPLGQSTVSFWYYSDATGTGMITVSDNAVAPDVEIGIRDATDNFTITAAPITATRFVILDPEDASVNQPVLVTVQAQDGAGHVDSSYQHDVTLSLSGSATGGGLIDIVNGVGTITISDQVAEIVTLSLDDSESSGLNVDSTQTITFMSSTPPPSPPTGGGGGALSSLSGPPFLSIPFSSSSSTTPVPPSDATSTPFIRLYGHAYPHAQILILADQGDQKDIAVRQELAGSESGEFDIRFFAPFRPLETYGFSVTDSQRRASPLQFIRFDTRAAVSLERHVIIAPTISLRHGSVARGEPIVLDGEASPGANLHVHLDDQETALDVRSADDGTYSVSVDTDTLSLGRHGVQIHQHRDDGTFSELSVKKIFMVISPTQVLHSDLNKDGQVTVSDWQTYLSLWKTLPSSQRFQLDIDGDGVADSSDLSIFLHSIVQK